MAVRPKRARANSNAHPRRSKRREPRGPIEAPNPHDAARGFATGSRRSSPRGSAFERVSIGTQWKVRPPRTNVASSEATRVTGSPSVILSRQNAYPNARLPREDLNRDAERRRARVRHDVEGIGVGKNERHDPLAPDRGSVLRGDDRRSCPGK